METLTQLDQVQRKVEAIIHGTTEEMRDAQPGVIAWRNEILRKIIEYRVELVNRLKPLNYTSISINHNAMTEQLARKLITDKYPLFPSLNPAIQEACVAGFIFGYDNGYDDGFQTAVAAERGIQRIQAEPPDPLQDHSFLAATMDLETGTLGFLKAIEIICDDFKNRKK